MNNIGDDCIINSSFLSNLVGLYSRTINDFHPIDYETRNRLTLEGRGGDSDLAPARPIHIGKNGFIGCNSVILKGAEFGDGCVVGAGAVVTGKFEANSVVAAPRQMDQKSRGDTSVCTE